MSSKNPIKVGDTVSIKRGDGRLTGTVVKTVLARCHIDIDDRVFIEDWHGCRRKVRSRSRLVKGKRL